MCRSGARDSTCRVNLHVLLYSYRIEVPRDADNTRGNDRVYARRIGGSQYASIARTASSSVGVFVFEICSPDLMAPMTTRQWTIIGVLCVLALALLCLSGLVIVNLLQLYGVSMSSSTRVVEQAMPPPSDMRATETRIAQNIFATQTASANEYQYPSRDDYPAGDVSAIMDSHTHTFRTGCQAHFVHARWNLGHGAGHHGCS